MGELTVWVLLALILLFVGTAFAFIHAHSKKVMTQEHKASNARVLREFKRMAIYHPEKIVKES